MRRRFPHTAINRNYYETLPSACPLPWVSHLNWGPKGVAEFSILSMQLSGFYFIEQPDSFHWNPQSNQ